MSYKPQVRVGSDPKCIDGLLGDFKIRTLRAIAQEIQADWKKPYFGAVPYLQAMSTMNTSRDYYGADDGKSIVLYFLSNAKAWRGDVAKRVKIELKGMI